MKATQNASKKESFFDFKYFKDDLISGLLVSLLALPLSLGIANASDFPAAMGLVTAIVGGLVVALLAGSQLTIKGPAAGLIVIASGAVTEFGGGEMGWKLALGAIVVAGAFQVLFGFMKLGKLTDFFPLSVIHGMLAAIGLIIISKQFHVLLGIEPATLKGMGPIQLYEQIPHSIMNFNPEIAIIGLISLAIVFLWPMVKVKALKKIPVPVIVLLFAVPASFFHEFKNTFALVHIGNVMENIGFNADFSGATSHTGVFIKYVIMFALVGSIESLLTVKAIDILDPMKRTAKADKDLSALGFGNVIAGILGGLPMISEVARSSANILYGGKTRWANFFHGMFLLLFVLLGAAFIEHIPNAALAALLIGVGFKLAHPNEFKHTFEKGGEQFVIFMVTIILTLVEDLLVGVIAGVLVNYAFHFFNGLPLRAAFKANVKIFQRNDEVFVRIYDAACFSNFVSLKAKFAKIEPGKHVVIDFSHARLVDYSFQDNLKRLIELYESKGGTMEIVGLNHHIAISNHPLATKRLPFACDMDDAPVFKGDNHKSKLFDDIEKELKPF